MCLLSHCCRKTTCSFTTCQRHLGNRKCDANDFQRSVPVALRTTYAREVAQSSLSAGSSCDKDHNDCCGAIAGYSLAGQRSCCRSCNTGKHLVVAPATPATQKQLLSTPLHDILAHLSICVHATCQTSGQALHCMTLPTLAN